MAKPLTLVKDGANKKLKAPENYELLIKKLVELYKIDIETLLLQYTNVQNTTVDIISDDDYKTFLAQDIPLKLQIQKQVIFKPPQLRIMFNGQDLYISKSQMIEDLTKNCLEILHLGNNSELEFTYIDENGDLININDQDDYEMYLDNSAEPLLNVQVITQESGTDTLLDEQQQIITSSNILLGNIADLVEQSFEKNIEQNAQKDAEKKTEQDTERNILENIEENVGEGIVKNIEEKIQKNAEKNTEQNSVEKIQQNVQKNNEITLQNQVSTELYQYTEEQKNEQTKWEQLTQYDQDFYSYVMSQPKETLQENYQEIQKEYPALAAYMKQNHPEITTSQENQDIDPLTQLNIGFELFLPKTNDILSKLPSKTITIKNFQQFKEILSQKINDSPAYHICQDEIDKRLAVAQDFSTLFTHDIFVKDSQSPLYNFDDYKLLVFFAERLNEKSCRAFALYGKMPGKPLPYAFKSVTEAPKICIPLSSFQELFNLGQTSLISVGPAKLGKSKLLNKLFTPIFSFAEEVDSKAYPLHWGAQVVCHTEEFPIGFNTFDVNMDFSSQMTTTESQYDTKKTIEILNSFPKKSSMILLHVLTKEDMVSNVDVLMQNGWSATQIFCIQRDSSKINIGLQMALNGPQRQGVQIKSITKIERNNIFESEIAKLRVDLLNYARNVQVEPVDYYEYEKQAENLDKNEFKIHMVDKLDKDFEMKVVKIFNKITPNEANEFNLHNELFKGLQLRGQLYEQQKNEKNAHQLQEHGQKIDEINKCQNNIKKIEKQLKQTVPHEAVFLFNDIIKNQSGKMMRIFERQIGIWQEPIVKPLNSKRFVMTTQLQSLQNKLIKNDVAVSEIANDSSLQEKHKDSLLDNKQKQEILNNIETQKTNIKQVSRDLDKVKVSKEHFFRELDYLYERYHRENPQNIQELDREIYLNSLVEYVRSGCEFEFIDGENNRFHEETMTEIFTRLENKYFEVRPFVISIIGPQSTGKSTVLNFLFNTSFQMSAGRCTKGMYASCFETDYPSAKRVVILDSEGLLSIEKNDPPYDKKITTLAMSLSQVLLINIMGDFNQAMKEVLAMSLLAGKQLKAFLNKRPILIFVLRNCIDDNILKMREIVDKIGDELKNVADASNVKVHEIVDYREDDSFCLMYSAFNKDDYSSEGKKLYSFCIVNDSFRNKSVDLLQKIFKEADTPIDRALNIKQLIRNAKDIWASLGSYNSLLSLKSIKELNDRQQLQQIVNQIRNTYVEKDFQQDVEQNIQKQEVVTQVQTLSQKIENLLQSEKLTLLAMKQQLLSFDDEYKEMVKNQFKDRTRALQLDQDLLKEYQDMLQRNVILIIQRNQDELQRREAFSDIMKSVNSIKDEMNYFMKNLLNKNAAQLESGSKEDKAKLSETLEQEFSITIDSLEQQLLKSIEQKKRPKEAIRIDTNNFLKQVLKLDSMNGKAFLSNEHLNYANQETDTGLGNTSQILQMIISPNEDTQESLNLILTFMIDATGFNTEYYTNKIQSQRKQAYQSEDSSQILDSLPGQSIPSGLLHLISKLASKPYNFVANIIKSDYSQQRGYQTLAHISNDIKNKNSKKGTKDKNDKKNKKEEEKFSPNQNYNDYYQDTTYQQTYNQAQIRLNNRQITAQDIEIKVVAQLQQTGVYGFIVIRDNIISACTKISNSQGINLSMIQSLLNDIEQAIKQSENYYLTPYSLHFKNGYLEQVIASAFFDYVLKFMIKQQDEKIKEEKIKFQEQKVQLSALFKDKLMSFIGDSDAAKFMANLLYNNLLESCKKKSEFEYKQMLTEQTCFQPVHLLDLGDRIVKESTQNEKDFIDWATNISVYLDRIFDKEFSEKEIKVISQNLRDRKAELIQNSAYLLQSLGQIKNIFHDININKIDLGQIQRSEAESLQILQHKLLMECIFEPLKAIYTIKQINKEFAQFQISEEDAEIKFKTLPTTISKIHLLGNQESILIDAKITDLQLFIGELILCLEQLKENIQSWLEEKINIPQIAESVSDNIKYDNKSKALGCREVCPYCGAKCGEDKGHTGPHTTNRHRLMGLRGSHKYVDGRLQLIEICCNSQEAQKSQWKDAQSQETVSAASVTSIDANVRELIEREGCTMGALNFSLSWYDPNDIDIWVQCPCGSTLCRGSRCDICGGQSDCDMNIGSRNHATAPFEHVQFTTPKTGLYKIWVTKHQANRSYGGQTGGPNSNFKISVHSGSKEYQIWTGNSDHLINYQFNYAPSLKFYDHCQKYYPQWIITEGSALDQSFVSNCIIAMKKNETSIKQATKLM